MDIDLQVLEIPGYKLDRTLGGLNVKNIVPKDERIDDEWVHLLKEAKDIGLSKEEVKNFLRTGLRTCKTV